MVQPLSKEDGSVMEEYSSDPPRTQANFDKLFSGMPSLDEILTKDEGETGNEVRESEIRPVSDNAWFDDKKRQIQEDYQQILEDMKSQIEQQTLMSNPNHQRHLKTRWLRRRPRRMRLTKRKRRVTKNPPPTRKIW
jgi:hypothetical protein